MVITLEIYRAIRTAGANDVMAAVSQTVGFAAANAGGSQLAVGTSGDTIARYPETVIVNGRARTALSHDPALIQQVQDALRPGVYEEVGLSNLLHRTPLPNPSTSMSSRAQRENRRLVALARDRISSVTPSQYQRELMQPLTYGGAAAVNQLRRFASSPAIMQFIARSTLHLPLRNHALVVGCSIIRHARMINLYVGVTSASVAVSIAYAIFNSLQAESEAEEERPDLPHVPPELWSYALYNSTELGMNATVEERKEHRRNPDNYFFPVVPASLKNGEEKLYHLVNTPILLSNLGYFSNVTMMTYLDFLNRTQQLQNSSRYALDNILPEVLGLNVYEIELEKHMNRLLRSWRFLITEAKFQTKRLNDYYLRSAIYNMGGNVSWQDLLKFRRQVEAAREKYTQKFILTKNELQQKHEDTPFQLLPILKEVKPHWQLKDYRGMYLDSWEKNWYMQTTERESGDDDDEDDDDATWRRTSEKPNYRLLFTTTTAKPAFGDDDDDNLDDYDGDYTVLTSSS